MTIAAALVIWSCSFYPANPPADMHPPEFTIQIREDESQKLLTILGDVGHSYLQIIEDDRDGLIAIDHKSNTLHAVLIDKRSGKFQNRAFVTNGYEDGDVGVCKRLAR